MEKIETKAIEFAKTNKKKIAARLTNPALFMPESHPISVFMAGSPGAGKQKLLCASSSQFLDRG